MSSRPNILWICTDQQRYDTLSCGGNPHVRTPHIDALAAGGARFDHAYAQSPVCTPSRASFMTGRYPRTTRCRQNGQGLPSEEVPVTRLLRDAGYRCGLAGKLHLNPCHPKHLQGKPEHRDDDGYADDAVHWHHDHWPWAAYGQWLAAQGIDGAFTPLDGVRGVEIGPPSTGTATAWSAAMAGDFIRAQATRDEPWLFSLNLFDPHHPFRIPADKLAAWRERVESLSLPAYVPDELADKPVWQTIDHGGAYAGSGLSFKELDDTSHRWIRAAYYAMIEDIDEKVGELLAELEATGQRDNTLVVFMSDHGEMLGDHGIYLKGPYTYDPAVRVPLILNWPAHVQPSVRQAMVELVDVAPTLLAAAEIPAHPGMQGRSLWPLCTDATADDCHRTDVYCEFYNANFRYDPPAHLTMIRTATHKLVAAHGQASGELYDLLADPGEHRNLWDDHAHLHTQAHLLSRLVDRMAWTVDPLPPRQAMY